MTVPNQKGAARVRNLPDSSEQLTDRHYQEILDNIRSRPSGVISGLWFNIVRYGDCDFVQSDLLDEQTGQSVFRPIAGVASEIETKNISGLSSRLTGHPVEKEEETLLVSYLSSMSGGDVELIIPERTRTRTCAWGRFNETCEYNIYRTHIYPIIIKALESIGEDPEKYKSYPCSDHLCCAGLSRSCGKKLLDMGCGCGDLIDSIICRFRSKKDMGAWEACGCGNLIETTSRRRPDLECYGIDINPENIRAAEEKKILNVVQGDCEYLDSYIPEDIKFDIVICCGLLNKQVTSKLEAGNILERAVDRLIAGGHIIITGYSACHLTAEDLAGMGIHVLCKSIPENIFKSYYEYHLRQFYICRKP